MPISMAPSMTSNSAASPTSWPLVRGRPGWLAHRRVAVHDTATCARTRSAGRAGGVALPEGWGRRGRTMVPERIGSRSALRTTSVTMPPRSTRASVSGCRVPGATGGRSSPAAALDPVPLLRRVGRLPVALQQRDHLGRSSRLPGRPRPTGGSFRTPLPRTRSRRRGPPRGRSGRTRTGRA